MSQTETHPAKAQQEPKPMSPSAPTTDMLASAKERLMQNAKAISNNEVRELSQFTVVKRNGMLVPFRKERILMALEAAFRDTKKIPRSQPLPPDIYTTVQLVADLVCEEALHLANQNTSLTVEGIQDIVEMKLIETNHHDVARDYMVYRDQHKALREDSPRNLKVLRSDGSTLARFNPMKIAASLENAFRTTMNIQGITPDPIINAVNLITNKVVEQVVAMSKAGSQLTVDWIEDEIERQLMTESFYVVAKYMIISRASQQMEKSKAPPPAPPIIPAPVAIAKAEIMPVTEEIPSQQFTITRADGTKTIISEADLAKHFQYACRGLEDKVSAAKILEDTLANFYEGIKEAEVDLSHIMAARAKIEKEPAYSQVASRLLLDVIYRETVGVAASHPDLTQAHQRYFKDYITNSETNERLASQLQEFDLDQLANALKLERDLQFEYLGLQTLYDRYFIHKDQRRLETPQIFWMRVAMGLSYTEGKQRNEKAIEFYNVLSSFLFVSGTPTLFNSGTSHSQLSSCFLSTIMDDLHNIFKVIADDAQLSKYAGGIGNDWTNVRATGAMIKGTNGTSQGVIPFLKVANDTAVAVNQGGKRKGAMCAYLETWHLDIEDFLDLRKNTGDERRRTHDMNTANWIPDLFMQRVESNGYWTLFSPSDVPDLHDLYGAAFEKRYREYEQKADSGEIKLFKRLEAIQLWRKMLSMLFETGHPWLTFKDPSNIRSPQNHSGVIHSSNLCTEILLNTSVDETAVCNLGSINLALHCTSKGLNRELLASTIRTAIRMLDNVIDINFYPTKESKAANVRHRPIGLGQMGFQDCLYMLGISYASHEAIKFADESMEMISYYAILASSELAKERGTYSTYKGSQWERGLLPIDTIDLLEKERGGYLEMDRSSSLNWDEVRASIKKHGMRNSNTMAIAPTATISNITGITQSIEPMYKHLFVKSNLSGEFTIPNIHLVNKLKELNIWDEEMIDDLKYFDGSIVEIERIPAEVKKLFLTAFEIEPEWIIECASRRQKWIDMGQSLNLYLAEPSGKKLHYMYMLAWRKGLKTTYYLRSLGATQIEKSTTDINKRGLQPRWMKSKSASSNIKVERAAPATTAGSCNLGEACESCQ
jgi:ribonucleoside-diphosphate reductase alpha chain